ncbi:acetyl-CoA carboxylase biotin carboxyl carrier protein [Rhizobiaceae bacterium]|nr:acetyl-CoA carboxylase biotin carboxyl carrier protein [Rhizobiaceae bacterium]
MAKKPNIDVELVRALADLLKDSDLAEIEVEDEETRIRLARATAAPVSYQAAPPAPVAAAPAPAAPAAAAAPAKAAAPEGEAVPSPMVGTAYLSPSPDSPPFVEVGQQVTKGQTVLIIEAMKTMNQIAAPRDGKVLSLDVVDGQPVEFGETLLRLA